ncbi:fluoride efflux transporter FluC [Varibaculum vaginae]|uniref:fluoride efflux transporter FluC n=1 Tax=Varibaculum vaginae TaxID=2364797 RepID=UPI000F082D87|nr:CrcB family protein [Varibaculum vaginae]
MSEIGFVLALGACGGVGALCRWGIDVSWLKLVKRHPAGGIALVNVLACLLGGVLVSALVSGNLEANCRVYTLLATGFLGGFSTFSTFVLDIFSIAERGNWRRAWGALLLVWWLSLLAAIAGFVLGLWFFSF